eukprot:1159467-Pelagomonas_calceolata.AAC.2
MANAPGGECHVGRYCCAKRVPHNAEMAWLEGPQPVHILQLLRCSAGCFRVSCARQNGGEVVPEVWGQGQRGRCSRDGFML